VALKTQKVVGLGRWYLQYSPVLEFALLDVSKSILTDDHGSEMTSRQRDSSVLMIIRLRLRCGAVFEEDFCGGLIRRMMERLLLVGVFGSFLWGNVGGAATRAQAPAASRRVTREQATKVGLTVDRIYGEPSLSGHPKPGIAWTRDGKHISFFKEVDGGRGKGVRKDPLAEGRGDRREPVAGFRREAGVGASGNGGKRQALKPGATTLTCDHGKS
jgi:hypothetical protein